MDLNVEDFDVGLKLSVRTRLGPVYNLDLVKRKQKLLGGISVGGLPYRLHGGCLLGYDTIRKCSDKVSTRLHLGISAHPILTKPAPSPLAFPAFGFEDASIHDQDVLRVSFNVSKKIDDKLDAGFTVGTNGLTGLGAAFSASYSLQNDHSASVYVNHSLDLGFGISRQIDAYYAGSARVFLSPKSGLSFGLHLEYRPDPPIQTRIKHQLKEFKLRSGEFSDRLRNELKRTADDIGIKERT